MGYRLLLIVGCVLLPRLAPAAGPAPPVVRELEQQLRSVIESTESSIVAIVVSQSEDYEKIDAEARSRGRLDGYQPPQQFPPGMVPPAAGQERWKKLDLRDPENLTDHLFGSGVVLDAAEGLILTMQHLIAGATKIYVRSASGGGSYANIQAADARADLAVLKLIDPVPGLKSIRFADVRTEPGLEGHKPTVFRGMWVISMGHPLAAGFGDGKPSASWGILSNVRRKAAGPVREEQRTLPLHQYGTLLQTDARVTLGCSGGVLLNLDGEAIGMTTPLAAVMGSDTAGGFAIPFDRNYRRIIDVLRQGREVEYGFLGISIDPTHPAPAQRGIGLRIGQVTPGTPAAEAGLIGHGDGRFGSDGDVILAIDGQPIREQDDLFLALGAALAGNTVRLKVSREGKIREVEVRLAKYFHTLPRIVSQPVPAVHGLRPEYSSVLYLQLQQAGDHQVLRVGLPLGVLVGELIPGSAAEAQFKRLGQATSRWMITRVNETPVSTPAEFFQAAKSGRVRLTVIDPTDPETVHTIDLPGATTPP
jgi:serine protease Do